MSEEEIVKENGNEVRFKERPSAEETCQAAAMKLTKMKQNKKKSSVTGITTTSTTTLKPPQSVVDAQSFCSNESKLQLSLNMSRAPGDPSLLVPSPPPPSPGTFLAIDEERTLDGSPPTPPPPPPIKSHPSTPPPLPQITIEVWKNDESINNTNSGRIVNGTPQVVLPSKAITVSTTTTDQRSPKLHVCNANSDSPEIRDIVQGHVETHPSHLRGSVLLLIVCLFVNPVAAILCGIPAVCCSVIAFCYHYQSDQPFTGSVYSHIALLCNIVTIIFGIVFLMVVIVPVVIVLLALLHPIATH